MGLCILAVNKSKQQYVLIYKCKENQKKYEVFKMNIQKKGGTNRVLPLSFFT